MSDLICGNDDNKSTKICFSEKIVPRPKAPNSSLPVDLAEGTTILSEFTTTGSNLFPQMLSDDFGLPSCTIENNPPSAQTTELVPTTTSSDHNQSSSRYCKTIAKDCFVELDLPLPTDMEREWDQKIYNQLSDVIFRSVDGEVTIECVMARLTSNGAVKPTILLMCSMPKHRKQIEKILRGCNYIPKHFRRKVALLDIYTLGNFSPDSSTVLPDQKILVDMAVDKKRARRVIFGSLAKLHSDNDADFTVFSTIGGVILIAGTLYGLTTAHGIYKSSAPCPEVMRFSGTNSIS